MLKIWEKSRKFRNCKIYKKNTLVPVPEQMLVHARRPSTILDSGLSRYVVSISVSIILPWLTYSLLHFSNCFMSIWCCTHALDPVGQGSNANTFPSFPSRWLGIGEQLYFIQCEISDIFLLQNQWFTNKKMFKIRTKK